MRFSIRLLLYVVTLSFTALHAFGPIAGIPATLFVLFIWRSIFRPPTRIRAHIIDALTAVVLFWMLVELKNPAIMTYPRGKPVCASNMRDIGSALLSYMHVHGAPPPAYIADEDGKPLHSWRTLNLPFMEEGRLYDAYDFNEPWDGPNNRKLSSNVVRSYTCPHTADGNPCHTQYFAVVGDQAAWPKNGPLSVINASEGAGQTFIIIEAHRQDVHWMEPKDLTYEEAIELLSDSDQDDITAFVLHRKPYAAKNEDVPPRRNVLLADGAVETIYASIPRETARALLSARGDDKLTESDLAALRPKPNPLSHKLWGYIVFAVVALAPLTWAIKAAQLHELKSQSR